MNTLVVGNAPEVTALENIFQEHCPQFQIVGRQASLKEGIANTRFQPRPELIFVDANAENMALLAQNTSTEIDIVLLIDDVGQALHTLQFNVIGCILKPFSVADILNMMINVARYRQQRKMLEFMINSTHCCAKPRRNGRIPLPQSQHIEFVNLDEIAHIEAERQYCVFNLLDKRRIITSKNIGEYEKLLGGYPFMRVHRSHIVNLEHVYRFHRNDDQLEMSDGQRIAVSRNQRDNVLVQLSLAR